MVWWDYRPRMGWLQGTSVDGSGRMVCCIVPCMVAVRQLSRCIFYVYELTPSCPICLSTSSHLTAFHNFLINPAGGSRPLIFPNVDSTGEFLFPFALDPVLCVGSLGL
jgi:hypothetical protein